MKVADDDFYEPLPIVTAMWHRPNPRPRLDHILSILWYPGVWRPVRHNASKAGCNCMQIWHAATDTHRDQASSRE